jgi:hypothetical protein
VDDSEEQAAIALVARLHAEGKSFREIAAALTAEGHRPKRSSTWHPMMVRRIVARLDGPK